MFSEKRFLRTPMGKSFVIIHRNVAEVTQKIPQKNIDLLILIMKLSNEVLEKKVLETFKMEASSPETC